MIQRLKDALQGKAPLDSKRSPQWPKVRAEHLKKNPVCAMCGGTSKLEVHHVVPFHVDPSKELDPANLITLCEAPSYGVICHLFVGHLGSYKSVNPRVARDAATWNKRFSKRKETKESDAS